ncbi:hypothetical protein C8R45DRAFT_1014408 [Mycena sanguinolenta]|nr:hypothetical protein C8R45DRAFT_1014408 [Mycena sanguinolenta]
MSCALKLSIRLFLRTCHYLEAQIRQKDQIIQSLLEQLHISPLSISSYRMGTSPSDTINQASRSDLNPSLQPVAGGIYTDFASFISSPKSIDPYLASIALQQPDTGNGNEVKNAKPSVPFGLIEDLGPRYSCCQGPGNVGERKSDGLEDTVGGANAAYSALGPSRNLRMRAHPLEQHFLPEILTHGIVVREDIAKLFGIFYANINPFLSLLDPVLHTPTSTFRRCPFLFTVVCAVSSRYYTEKSEIYPIAMHLAKRSAAKALNDGRKSVELCQAYILLSIYAVPTRKWEEDCSSLYTGLAIRLAIDLNLHQAPTGTTLNGSEKGERELLNRARVWMICFNLDRSAATQSGKPPTIEPDPHMWRRSNDWYQLSPYNSLCDMHLCAFTGLLLIVADFHDAVFSDPSAPFGPNKNVDFRSVTITHSARLAALSHKWTNRFAQASDSKDLAFAFQSKLFTFLGSYWRLAMFSFSFEQAYRIGLGSTDNIFFIECLECAKTVLSSMIDGLWPSAFMRYCPDELFTFVAFASAFLIKLLIEFSSLISEREESEMYDLIQRVIRTLNSPEIAVDDHHPSKIHAQFIARVLSHHHPNNAVYHRTPSMISNIAGSSMGYGHQWHTSPMFTISSLLGVETAYCSGYGPDEYQSFYAQFTCPTAE